MSKKLSFFYGLVSYGVFFFSFLYAIGFTGNIIVPKSIDTGGDSGIFTALIINMVLLGIFAVQHTIMARPGFKQWWTKIIPQQIERSTFVLIASLMLLLLYWQWRPMTAVVWNLQHPVALVLMNGIFWLGWSVVLISTFMINHFDLFGLRQVYLYIHEQKYHHVEFKTSMLYKYVRHPIMLGFIIAFWATSQMTVGHLLFAAGTTAYILIGIKFEERNLKQFLGEKYENYQHCVPMLIPFSKAWKDDADNECKPFHFSASSDSKVQP